MIVGMFMLVNCFTHGNTRSNVISRSKSMKGWLNELMISIMISMGMRDIGAPWGRKWANEAFSFWWKPRITAPAHSGIAIPKFVDSCFGVNVCGKSPRRLVEPINTIKNTSLSDHLHPLGE